jgi:O-antigen/teichoic acid export membrane protein
VAYEQRASIFERVARAVVRLLRPGEVAGISAADRSRSRYRRVGLYALTSAIARVVSLAGGLVTLFVAFKYLGAEQYGLWVTITSTASFLALSDLGVGAGIVNVVAEREANVDRQQIRVIVSSTFFLLLVLSAALAMLFLIVFQFVPWPSVYNVVTSEGVAVAGSATLVFVFVTLIGIPFSLADGVRSGFQEGYANNLSQAAGAVLAVIALLAEVTLHVGLPALVLALAGGATLGSGLNAVALVRRRSWLIPRRSLVDWRAGRAAVRRGLIFLAIGVAWVIAIQSDALVIARILGPTEVSSYAIPLRISAVVVVLCNLFIAPLWPAYKDALSRGDAAWASRTLK